MAEPLGVVPYVLMATGAGVLGGIAAYFWVPSIRARSAIQHFAAGLVIAAVASEVIPAVERVGTAAGILGGFAAGGLLMIGLKWLVLRFERRESKKGRLPVGLAVAAAFDTIVDGGIISAGFTTGPRVGVFLAIALAVELVSLTLSVGSEFQVRERKPWPGLAVTTGISMMLPIGAFGAGSLLASAPEPTVAACLAFGAAALIYLIAEELLVESIEAEESIFSTAMLFVGFLCVLALKVVSRK
jgi:ZIP family zinc transporter